MMYRNLYAGLILLFVLAGVAAASGPIQTYLGDTVKLSGYSPTSPTVYLFLTGPNLPVNGVALDNINSRADQGGFTQVSVDGNDHWEYDWNTGSLGGRLDAGTYTVWVVDGPNDRSQLSEADYSTISVTLGIPGVGGVSASASPGSTVTPVVVPGTLNVSSVPDNVSVVINGNYQGRSPLSIPGLAPGTYLVNFSRFNYEPLSTPATVEAGATTEVTVTLRPKTGTLVINSSPAGAQIVLDGNTVGTAPVTQTGIFAGTHTINATLAGYVPIEVQADVIADQSVTTTIGLNKTPTVIPGIPTPVPVPVIIGACAGALLLFAFFRPRTRV
jgi:hypothetical protein